VFRGFLDRFSSKEQYIKRYFGFLLCCSITKLININLYKYVVIALRGSVFLKKKKKKKESCTKMVIEKKKK
jgi:hypothetical protein